MSKRILSLVLALVMVLGTLSTMVFAETELDPKVQWLIDQDLIQGDGSGNYDLDKPVQRSVLARIVALGLEDEVAANALQAVPSGFADMTPAHWANGVAAYANAKGFMIGNEKNEFMPDMIVSYDQALVVLTKIALGRDLTAEEKAGSLTWYAPYVAKASELGLTEGVNITNVGAPAVKEDILIMLYNVLNNKDYGNYTVLKAIVLENDRIARLGANEVTVEVIEEVQRANFVEESRDFKGEQYTYELPAKFNAEDLLGKVVDLSINKDNKVVEVKVDESYKVETGAISGINASRLTINRKQYIVNFDERYNKDDERVYRTYLNDKDLKYVDFAKEHDGVEYARVTVKAGKVYFIDAYDFDDVMPVKEIKEIRGSDHIVSYDDIRSGNTIETKVSTARVILVNGDTFTRGTLEDVKADNVIHTYKVGSSTKYVVLQDKAITGELERIKEDKDGEYIVVDGEEYTIPTTEGKEAVYEFETDGKFYTLEAEKAYKELDNFKGEDVKVLLGLNGEVQYIGSEVGFGEYVGVATKTTEKEIRVLNPDNETNDYMSNLDTGIYVANTRTKIKGLHLIADNSLVYINANDDKLDVVRDFDYPVDVTSLTNRDINGLRITDETVVYVVNTKGRAEVRKIADVVKAYDKLSETDKAKVKVSLIDEAEFEEISVRGYKGARNTHVHTMVVYGLNIAPAKHDPIFGKLLRYTDRKAAGRSTIVVELADGTERTFTIDSSVNEENVNFVRGNIYEIVESKETEDLALDVEKVSFVYKEVKSIDGMLYTFTDNTTKYETRNTEIFGRRPRAKDKISYLLDEDYTSDMIVIVNPGFDVEEKEEEITGIVTYINADNTALLTDNSTETIEINEKTVLRVKNANGTYTNVALGLTEIFAAPAKLVKGDQIEAKDNVITIIKSAQAFADEVDALIDDIPATITAANLAEAKAAVAKARKAYDALTADQKALVTNLSRLTDAEDDIEDLEDAAAAKVVIDALTALPDAADVTLADKADIVAARKAYDGLTATQKALVTNLSRLTDAEDKIETLEADAKAVSDAAKALTTLAFDTTNDAKHNAPKIVLPVTAGITYTFEVENIVGNDDNGDAVVAVGGEVEITRDDVKTFTFDIKVTIEKGDAEQTKVFTVTVPTGNSVVTVK